jgi:hypothetical protein
MSKDRKSIDQIEALVSIVELGMQSILVDCGEGDAALAGLDEVAVDVGSINAQVFKTIPVAGDAPRSATKIQDISQAVNRSSMPLEGLPRIGSASRRPLTQ